MINRWNVKLYINTFWIRTEREVFELSVVAGSSDFVAGQDGLCARETTGEKVAPRGVKLAGTAVRPTEVS
jgi:hypothetical protein